jgi:ABC-type dipeptide/oligopeptide/nickel transport system permease subunit
LMVAENRSSLVLQPWPVVLPAVLIALLVIGANLVADAIARSLGTSADLLRTRAELHE